MVANHPPFRISIEKVKQHEENAFHHKEQGGQTRELHRATGKKIRVKQHNLPTVGLVKTRNIMGWFTAGLHFQAHSEQFLG